EGPGRPVMYGTTPTFLERLGLPSLAALPSLAPLLGAGAEEADAAEVVVQTEEDAAETTSGDVVVPQDEEEVSAAGEGDAPAGSEPSD
ncbi:MAG: hypothetical protein ACXVQJ_09810, partial [Actinomycetota bacterium]